MQAWLLDNLTGIQHLRLDEVADPLREKWCWTFTLRRLTRRVHVGSYTNAESRAAWRAIVAALQRTGAKPVIDHVFPFDQLPAAFARLVEGPMGKVLISGTGILPVS